LKRRILVGGAVVALLALGLIGADAVRVWIESGNVTGSSTVEFVSTELPTQATPKQATPGVVWPMYGLDPERLRDASGVSLVPPFKVQWTFHAHELVEFPPAIAYGRLYFANNAGTVFAVNTLTGKQAWTYDSGRCQAESPAVGFNTVYTTFLNTPPCNASGGTGEVIAFWASSGKVRWRRVIGPSESSPLLVGGRVDVGDWDGYVTSLSAASGKTIWSFHADGEVKGGLAYSNGLVYFGTYGGTVYALDATNGREVWHADGQPGLLGSGTFYATPSVAYDRVYIGSTDGKMYSFGATTGELRWSQSTGGYVYSSAAVWDERVYAGSYSDTFYCFNAATGQVLWSFPAGGAISGSPTVVAGIVYFSTLVGRTYGLNARTGSEVWTFPDGEYSPVVADATHIYLIGKARIYALVERRKASRLRHATRAVKPPARRLRTASTR